MSEGEIPFVPQRQSIPEVRITFQNGTVNVSVPSDKILAYGMLMMAIEVLQNKHAQTGAPALVAPPPGFNGKVS